MIEISGGLKNRGVVKTLRNDKPLVSIVTPVFNGKLFLEQTIQSIIAQTYENIEYIIIDGGSTDGTLEVIKKYEDKIDFWLSEHDSGMYEAINKGLKIASGDILAYLNSDDLYYPDSIKIATEYFSKHPDTELIYGNLDYIGPRNDFLYTYRSPKFRWSNFVSMDTSSIPQPASFWRSTIHKKIGYFDVVLKMCADFDFYGKAGKCCRIDRIKIALARYRIHGAQLTVLQGHRNKEEVGIIHKRYLGSGRIWRRILNVCFLLQLKLLNLDIIFKKACFIFKKRNSY